MKLNEHELIDGILAIQRKLEEIKDKIGDDQKVQEQYEKAMSQVVATRIAIHRLIALCDKKYESADESPV